MTALARLTTDLTVQRQRQQALDTNEDEARLWPPLVGLTAEEAFAEVPQVLANMRRAMAGDSFDDVVEAAGQTYDVRYLHVTDAQGRPVGVLLGMGYNVTGLVQAEQRATAARRQAEALLELVQSMTGDVTRMLSSGSVVLWTFRSGRYFPVGRRGEAFGGLNPRLETEGVPQDQLASLLGDAQRRSYLAGRHLPLRLSRAGVGGLALLPLQLRAGACQVVLSAYHQRPWNPAERELLETAGDILSAGLERTLRLSELEHDAGTDALTGVGNRRALNQALERGLSEADRSPDRAAGLAVVSIDLDGLKAVNDLQGHAHGDALLSRFAAELQAALPAGGSLFRLGGDEFVVLTPVAVEDRPSDPPGQPSWLRAAVEATRRAGFEMAAASAGEARFPHYSAVAAELLRLSDERLYAEKERRGGGQL